MKKNITHYYSFLATLLVAQIIATVFNLSKSIGYGQEIKHIEAKQEAILSKQSQLEQALSQEIAIAKIDSNDVFTDIKELAVVDTNNNLALR